MSEVELKFFKEVMEKYKTDKDIFKKINYIVEMYNNSSNLVITRINNLAEKFSGENYENKCFYREFYSEERRINYVIDIYPNDNHTSLQLFSREEKDNPKSMKKWEKDNIDIEAWLKKHNLFEGFKKGNEDRWTKEFKFPEEENALYEFTKKLIKLLEEDKEKIYSGK